MSVVARAQYLLDSNICIYLLEDLDSEPGNRAMARLEQCAPDAVAISAITFGEVLIGSNKRGEMVVADAFLSQFTVLPFDQASADCYAQLPFRRASFDRLIGATALAYGLTVITNNEADFADIPGLKVENWTA